MANGPIDRQMDWLDKAIVNGWNDEWMNLLKNLEKKAVIRRTPFLAGMLVPMLIMGQKKKGHG